MITFKKFRTIEVMFQPRKRLYTFRVKYLPTIRNKASLVVSKYQAKYIFGRDRLEFKIPEFGLLELEYILAELMDNEEYNKDLGLALISVKDLLEYIRLETWISARYSSKKYPLDYKRITKVMKFNILPNQRPAFEMYENIKIMAGLRGALIDAAAGSGKTYMALALTEALHYDRTIIIAPRQTLEEVWVKSVSEQLYKKPQTYKVLTSKDRRFNKERFIIFHYEFLEKAANDPDLIRKLRRIKPNIIIDEFHNFNNIKSVRTNALLKFINAIDPEDVILLTGTPIKMEINELVPMLYVLDKKFPSAITFFYDLYKDYNPTSLKLLKYRFGLYRRRIEKDLSNIPPVTILEKKVKLKNYEKYLIETIQKDMQEYRDKRYQQF